MMQAIKTIYKKKKTNKQTQQNVNLKRWQKLQISLSQVETILDFRIVQFVVSLGSYYMTIEF